MIMPMGKESVEQIELFGVCVGSCQKFCFLADPGSYNGPSSQRLV